MPRRKVDDIGPDEIHGYDVLVRQRAGIFDTKDTWYHKVGSEAAVRRWAKLKPNVVEILEVRPVTRAEWLRAYGDARLRM